VLKLTPVKANELKDFVKTTAQPKPDNRAKENAQELAQALTSMKAGFQDGTAIEVHGTGGAAYANYDQFVYEVYKSNWRPPAQLDDAGPTARLKVVIRKDGSVKSAEVVRGSGNRELDRSVEDLTRRVKFVREFPAGSKDFERTYFINFNLYFKATG
jgi:TonB family protein